MLSGGGSRGAYQAGCWAALHEADFRPELIVGTSAGALNGTMIAVGLPPDEIRSWWLDLRTKALLRTRLDLWRLRRWTGLRDAAPLRRLIEENLDVAALRASPLDLRVTAVDLERGHEVVFGKHEITADHLLASCALLPGIPPVLIDGRQHADGGHWTAFPLRHALEAGATEVHALLHDPLEPHPEPPLLGILDILRRQGDIVWHGRQAAEMEALRLRMELPRRDPRRLAPAKIVVHSPEPPFRNPILAFDPKGARAMYERGLEETQARLEAQAAG